MSHKNHTHKKQQQRKQLKRIDRDAFEKLWSTSNSHIVSNTLSNPLRFIPPEVLYRDIIIFAKCYKLNFGLQDTQGIRLLLFVVRILPINFAASTGD